MGIGKKTAAQVPFAKKAAATKAAAARKTGRPVAIRDRNRKYQIKAALAAAAAKKKNGKALKAHAGDADDDDKVDLASVKDRLAHRVGLLDKHEVRAITGVSFVSVWDWMRKGKFPPGITVVGKTKWRASEIADWLANLPLARLKPNDAAADQPSTNAAG
jgi:predicted DNA-binding transcriptional regulator AlpA